MIEIPHMLKQIADVDQDTQNFDNVLAMKKMFFADTSNSSIEGSRNISSNQNLCYSENEDKIKMNEDLKRLGKEVSHKTCDNMNKNITQKDFKKENLNIKIGEDSTKLNSNKKPPDTEDNKTFHELMSNLISNDFKQSNEQFINKENQKSCQLIDQSICSSLNENLHILKTETLCKPIDGVNNAVQDISSNPMSADIIHLVNSNPSSLINKDSSKLLYKFDKRLHSDALIAACELNNHNINKMDNEDSCKLANDDLIKSLFENVYNLLNDDYESSNDNLNQVNQNLKESKHKNSSILLSDEEIYNTCASLQKKTEGEDLCKSLNQDSINSFNYNLITTTSENSKKVSAELCELKYEDPLLNKSVQKYINKLVNNNLCKSLHKTEDCNTKDESRVMHDQKKFSSDQEILSDKNNEISDSDDCTIIMLDETNLSPQGFKSKDIKILCLKITLSFIKNDKKKSLWYPKVPITETVFIEAIFNQNVTPDLDHDLKTMYVSILEAMTIFKNKYKFLLKTISNTEDIVQLTLEKIPKSNNISFKCSENHTEKPQPSENRFKKRNKRIVAKIAIIDGVPMPFAMNCLQKILAFIEDSMSTSVIFKNLSVNEWTFLMNVKAIVKMRHMLINRLPKELHILLKYIGTHKNCGFSLTLLGHDKTKPKRSVSLMKSPTFTSFKTNRKEIVYECKDLKSPLAKRVDKDRKKPKQKVNASNLLLRAITKPFKTFSSSETSIEESSKSRGTSSERSSPDINSDTCNTSTYNDDLDERSHSSPVKTSNSSEEMSSSPEKKAVHCPREVTTLENQRKPSAVKSYHTSIERKPNTKPKTTIHFQRGGHSDIPNETASTSKNSKFVDNCFRGRSLDRRTDHMKNKLFEGLSVPLECEKAKRMMQLMGWNGGGLGTRGEGITEPIMPAIGIVTGAGLGHTNSGNKNIAKKGSSKSKTQTINDSLKPEPQTVNNLSKSVPQAINDISKCQSQTINDSSKSESQTINDLSKSLPQTINDSSKSQCETINGLSKSEPQKHSDIFSYRQYDEMSMCNPALAPWKLNKDVETRIFILSNLLEFVLSDEKQKVLWFDIPLVHNEIDFLTPLIRSLNDGTDAFLQTNFECGLYYKIQDALVSKSEVTLAAYLTAGGKNLQLLKLNENIDYTIAKKKSDETLKKYVSLDVYMSRLSPKESYGNFGKKAFRLFAFRLMMLEEILKFLESNETVIIYNIVTLLYKKHLKFMTCFIDNVNMRRRERSLTLHENLVAEQIYNKLGDYCICFNVMRRHKQIKLQKKLFKKNETTSLMLKINEYVKTNNSLNNGVKKQVGKCKEIQVMKKAENQKKLQEPKEENTDHKKKECQENNQQNGKSVQREITPEPAKQAKEENNACNEKLDLEEPENLLKDIKELEKSILKHDNISEMDLSTYDQSSDTENSTSHNVESIKTYELNIYKVVCITCRNPEEKITIKSVRTIQDLISDSIDNYDGFLPLLQCNGIVDDYLSYSCYDEQTHLWLQTVIGDKFLILDNTVNPEEKYRMQIKIKSFIDDDTEKILNRIKLYNRDLDVSTWMVDKKTVSIDFTLIDVELNSESFNYIKQHNFSIFIGIDKAQFSVIWD